MSKLYNSDKKEHNRKAQGLSSYSGYILFYMVAVVFTKILGFVREIMITTRFGFGVVSDGYNLGFSIPDLVYNMLIAGALSAAVVPMLSGAIERDEEDDLWPSLNSFFTLIIVLFFGFMLIGEIFAPQILGWLNPGQNPEVLDIAASVSRVIYLQTFFFILIAILTAVITANKVYGLPAFGDTVYNFFGLLAIAFLGAPNKGGAVRASWGIVVAALMYFLYMFYFGRPYMKKFRPRIKFKDRKLWRLVTLALPSLLSGTVRQLNTIVQQRFTGAFPGAHAITGLRNANTLFNLPYQIIINSVGAFLLPNVSGFLARGARKEASSFLSTTLKLTTFILLPAAVLFAVFPQDTVRAVFQWNVATYTDADVATTASLLRIFAFDLIISAFVYFMNQIFFAVQKNYITLLTSVLSLALNALFCEIYINVMGMGVEGLALASVSYNVIVLVVSYIIVRKTVPGLEIKNMGQFAVKGLVAAFFTFAALVLVGTIMPESSVKFVQLVQYVVYGLVALGSYFAAAFALGMREVKVLLNMVGGIFIKIKGRVVKGSN